MSAQPNTKFAPAPKTTVNGREMSFKEQLDQAAHDAREPDEPPKQNPIIEKGGCPNPSIVTTPSPLSLSLPNPHTASTTATNTNSTTCFLLSGAV